MDRLVDIFWIARYDYEPNWILEPHSHSFYQLIYVLDGEGTALIAGERLSLVEGTVVLAPPGVNHGLMADRGTRLKTLDTKFTVLGPQLDADIRRIGSSMHDESHRVRAVLEQVRIEGMKARPWYRQLCNALMLQALVQLLRDHSGYEPDEALVLETEPADEAVKRIVTYIEDNYGTNISLSDVGHDIGYSPEYLSKRFRQRMGVSFHHYLMCYRIRQARELLKYSAHAVKEVAFLTGFKSIHHFSRAFKDLEGVPPSTWRDREEAGVWKNVVIAPGFVNRDITRTPDGQPPTQQL